MNCPECGSTDLHGPMHDFYGICCVGCGHTLQEIDFSKANMESTVKPELDTDQRLILAEMRSENLKAIVDDLKSPAKTICISLFALGMSPEFRRPNAKPEVVLDYCERLLAHRDKIYTLGKNSDTPLNQT